MKKTPLTRDLRAASAGALLARQLQLCITAEANSRPYPSADKVRFTDPGQVAEAYELAGLILGLEDCDPEQKVRLVTLFQALAEIIAQQGSDLEARFFNMIFEGESKCIVRSYGRRGGTA